MTERLKPAQGEFLVKRDDAAPTLDLSAVVSKTTEIVVAANHRHSANRGGAHREVTTGFHPFVTSLSCPTSSRGNGRSSAKSWHEPSVHHEPRRGIREQRFEDYIVTKLIDHDDIDYFTQAELLYDLLGQAVALPGAELLGNELHEVFWTPMAPSWPA